MDINADGYLSQLQALLPRGMAWPRDAAATLTALLRAWADELARVDGRASSLLNESDPRTTFEMLEDWERLLGLPDACLGPTATIQERRAAVVGRLTALGGQNAAYYIAVAVALGYTITVDEFIVHTPTDDALFGLYGDDWAHVWRINSALDTIRDLNVEDDVEMPLAVWGNVLLECVMRRLKPAHTVVLFGYS